MANERLQFFVSSSMSELPEERAAVQRAVDGLELESFLYERDAHAAMGTARQQWEAELAQSGACIVILYRKLGEYTKGEIELARKLGTPILLYRKNDPDKVIEVDHAEYLRELENVDTGVGAARYFEEAADLETHVAADINKLVVDIFAERKQWERCGLAAHRRRARAEAAGLAVREAPRPEIFRKGPEEVKRLDEPPAVFEGRDDKIEEISAVLAGADDPVAVMGPYGIGRRSLLRYLVHRAGNGLGDRYPDGFGVIPKGVESTTEDMLQALWEIFYGVEDECRPVTVVDPDKRQDELAALQALIVIENLALDRNQLDEVAGQAEKSTITVTTEMSSAEWKGAGITLSELDEESAPKVFAAAYPRPVPAGSDAPVAKLCEKVGHSPYLIRRLAQQAGQDIPAGDAEADALAQWSAAIAGLDLVVLADKLVPPEARSAFDAVRTAQTAVPFTLFGETPGGTQSTAAAVTEGVAETQSPRLTVSPALGRLAGPPPDERAVLDRMLDAALGWSARSERAEIFDNRQFVLRMLDWAIERERWDDVIRLARNTEHAMAVGGRHGAWRRMLEGALRAARTLRPADTATEAWALHQLGSRALLRDELPDAREHLHEALDKRQAIGDTEGAALSRRNLGLIPMAIVSLALLFLGAFAYPTWIGSNTDTGLGLIGDLPVGELAFDEIAFDPVQAPVTQAVEKDLVVRSSLATGADFVAIITDVSGQGAFCVNDVCGTQQGTASGRFAPAGGGLGVGVFVPGQPLAAAAEAPADCATESDRVASELVVRVEPGEPCRLVVSFLPPEVGSYESTLTFTDAAGEVALSVPLRAEAVPPTTTTVTTTTGDTRALPSTTTTATGPPDDSTTTTTGPPDDSTATTMGPPDDSTTTTTQPVTSPPGTLVGPGGDGTPPPVRPTAGIDLAMTPRIEPAAAVYDYVITNTGEAPLQAVRITGGHLGTAVYTCGETVLDPGAWTGCFTVDVLDDAAFDAMFVTHSVRVLANTFDGRLVRAAAATTTEFGVVDLETLVDTLPSDGSFVQRVGRADPWTARNGDELRIAVPPGVVVVRQEGPAAADDLSVKNWSLVIECDDVTRQFSMAEGELSLFVEAGERHDCRITNSGVAIAEIPVDAVAFGPGPSQRVIEVGNVGTATFTVSGLTVVGAGFGIVDDGCTASPVAPGARCTITIEWDGAPGVGRLDVGYAGEVEGDSRVLFLTA